MDAQELRNLQEAYMEVYASPEQLDEISQKTATRAYAASKTGEFEGADSDRDIKRSDNLRRHIKRKFGAGAAKHADRAADSMTFGRKDASGRSKQSPKPRIEKSDYRTTKDGKMHKQDQRELKTDLRIKRDRRLRAARGEDTNEQVDIYDIILSHLLDEGYAETPEAAEAIMVNMSEEWRQGIISEAPGEWFGGLRDKARASRDAQMQASKPTPKPGPSVSSPFAKPASTNDSGRLTTYGAGGGSAAERRGQTRSQVMQQGAKNLETKNKPNPGPNFGR